MKNSAVKFLVGLYEKSMPNELELSEKLKVAAECGYDYLELSVDETDEKLSRLDWSDDRIRTLIDDMYAAACPIKSMCLSALRKFPLGHPDTEMQQQSLAVVRKAIVLACKLGIRIIQIPGYDVYYSDSTRETEAIFAHNLQAAVDIAAQNGVILAFETMENEFMNTVEKAMKWVKTIRSPYLQAYPDTGNITNAAVLYGNDVLDDLDCGAGHIAALHLKESKPGVFREVPYQEGHVDFVSIVSKAAEMGVRMFVTEFWYVGQENWKEVIKENRRLIFLQ